MAMPRTVNFNYDYRKGSSWGYEDLYAKLDFPIVKTDEQVDAELSKEDRAIVPYYRFDENVVTRSLARIDFSGLDSLSPVVSATLSAIFDKGVITDEGVRQAEGRVPSDILYVHSGGRARKVPVSEVLTISKARIKLCDDVQAECPSVNADSLLRESGAYVLVVPNLIYDSQYTDLVASENQSYVPATAGYVAAGEKIVSRGEIITAEVEQMLDSYKLEYETALGVSSRKLPFLIGNILVAVILLGLLCLSILFTSPKIFSDSRFYYILTIFTIFFLATLTVQKLGENLLFMFPYTLAALYLQAFMKPKVILPVYFVTLLPLLIYSYQGTVLFVAFLLAGAVSILVFGIFGRGWKQFLVALISFCVLSLVFLGFRCADLVGGNIFRRFEFFFVASFLSVAGYPLVYLFEKIFNLVSNSRLAELSDTSNKLLRELESKAPGTLQHSLQVMNMADALARAIDANTLLVRTGALYHDIGKMMNPLCFVENESLVTKDENAKYHNSRTAVQSAQDIIRHVTDGAELADKHGLPSVVKDFILTHHGTTTVRYFYEKYLSEGGSPENVADFTYPGRKPRTREQIILMLCDTVEAASRTLQEYTPEAYAEFVEKIIAGKMNDGQFEEAEISIAELGTIRSVLVSYLAQMHHERVVYPERNNRKRKTIWK